MKTKQPNRAAARQIGLAFAQTQQFYTWRVMATNRSRLNERSNSVHELDRQRAAARRGHCDARIPVNGKCMDMEIHLVFS
jgi:hypothetical protein